MRLLPQPQNVEALNKGYIPPFKATNNLPTDKTLGFRRQFTIPFLVTTKTIVPPLPNSTLPLNPASKENDETDQNQGKEVLPDSLQSTISKKIARLSIEEIGISPVSKPVFPEKPELKITPIATPEQSSVKFFKVYYTKKAHGANKHYEDGFLRSAAMIQLLGSTGALITQRPKTSEFSLETGICSKLGLFLVEIVEEIPRDDFVSGRCFIGGAIPGVQAEIKVVQMDALGETLPVDAFILDQESNVFVPSFLTAHLRPHQRQGVQFMYECVTGKRGVNVSGCILADSMGLGKTLQTITLVYTLVRKDGPRGQLLKKVIIATPKTLIENWKNEFLKWVGATRLLPLACLGQKKDKEKALKLFSSGPLPVLLISYETLKRHVQVLGRSCDLLICDEGHRLKNLSIDTTKLLNQISCKRRILLTGTPLQNNLKEFFACMSFANPALIDSWEKFNNVFAQPIIRGQDPAASIELRELAAKRNEELQTLTTTFILRRTGEVLERLLPPRHEYLVFLPLSDLQERLYLRCLQSQYAKGVCEGSSMSVALSLISVLRKLVNHPSLVFQGGKLDPELRNSLIEYSHSALDSKSSSKFAFLEQLLKHSLPASDKVLVVSSFTSTLKALESFCHTLGVASFRLDGDTSDKRRMELVNLFNGRSEEKVFLLSTKAGGCGLNLVGANRLVLFDADWNPSSDKQAMGRIWRDGQTKPVFIYRLFCSGTLEEKIHQLQANKEGLFASVVDSKKVISRFSKENLKEIFTYSRKCQTYAETDDVEGLKDSFLKEMRELLEVVKEKKAEWVEETVKEEQLDFSTAVEDDCLKRRREEESDEEDSKRIKQG